jgi:hypothetical protein
VSDEREHLRRTAEADRGERRSTGASRSQTIWCAVVSASTCQPVGTRPDHAVQ